MDRIGYYCWAGPGTIRMINLKYFNPKIDEQSLMSSYEYDYLSKVKEVFGITDFWATYSWGFSDETEKPDRDFLIERVNNFKKAGLKLHAYIQGTNLVYEDFKDKKWFCEDEKNRSVMYFRSRRVACLNNPGFKNYIKNKIINMYDKGFDGIFMDNIQMGQLGIPTSEGELPFNFVGCNCEFCRGLFLKNYNLEIPNDLEKDFEVTRKYLNFRVESTNCFLKEVAEVVHNGNMEFGTNSFDPKFNMNYVYGTDLNKISEIQDYVMFENHSLPDSKHNNSYINELIEKINKSVFVVSYKKGIGFDSEFTQKDFNNIYNEDKNFKFCACLKGSEYVTNGVWHNLNPENFKMPKVSEEMLSIPHLKTTKSLAKFLTHRKLLRNFLKKYYNPLETWYLENKFGRKMFGIIFSLITH